MFDARRNEARERVTAPEKQRYIRWLTESVSERLDLVDSKKQFLDQDPFRLRQKQNMEASW